ncbi:MAG: hypothetical protein JOS17DRAFT_831413 [Linnemannia elongata]|nr:MAG: hypothetical protein JOS17DRAFT_831413 [Linnemannia elongata]
MKVMLHRFSSSQQRTAFSHYARSVQPTEPTFIPSLTNNTRTTKMKIHPISLFLVAIAALANSAPNADGRTLIGDEFTYRTQGDSFHGNTHTTSTTTITRIHKEPPPEAEQWIRESGLFDRHVTGTPTTAVVLDIKDIAEPRQLLDRRGLIWGSRSTSISNVNDNSQNTQKYNSRGNQSKTITKVVSTNEDSTGSRGQYGGEDSWLDMRAEEDEKEKVLDHHQSQSRRFLYEFHPSRNPQPQHQGDDIGVSSIKKRGTITLTTTATAIVDFDDNGSKKKVDGISRRNLVTIQIINQNTNTNTNEQFIDTSNHSNHDFPVKVVHRNNKSNNDKEKKKGGSSPNPRLAAKGNKKPSAKSRQYKSHDKKAGQPKKSAHATNLSSNKSKSKNRNRKISSNKPRPSAKYTH